MYKSVRAFIFNGHRLNICKIIYISNKKARLCTVQFTLHIIIFITNIGLKYSAKLIRFVFIKTFNFFSHFIIIFFSFFILLFTFFFIIGRCKIQTVTNFLPCSSDNFNLLIRICNNHAERLIGFFIFDNGICSQTAACNKYCKRKHCRCQTLISDKSFNLFIFGCNIANFFHTLIRRSKI